MAARRGAVRRGAAVDRAGTADIAARCIRVPQASRPISAPAAPTRTSLGLLAIGHRQAARALRQAPQQRTVELDDYVLTQPPVYTGPPRPPGYLAAAPRSGQAAAPIPSIADFLKAAAEQYDFVPDRPKTDAEFKQAYAKVARGRGPHQGSGRPHLCLRDRRQRHLRRPGRHRRQPQGRAADLAGDGLQPVAQHQHA